MKLTCQDLYDRRSYFSQLLYLESHLNSETFAKARDAILSYTLDEIEVFEDGTANLTISDKVVTVQGTDIPVHLYVMATNVLADYAPEGTPMKDLDKILVTEYESPTAVLHSVKPMRDWRLRHASVAEGYT